MCVYVKSFSYLGSTVNSKASVDNDMVNHISKASKAFGKLRYHLWNERGISLNTKIGVYKAVVLTTLLYRSDTWTLCCTYINQLDVFHKQCLCSIYRKPGFKR